MLRLPATCRAARVTYRISLLGLALAGTVACNDPTEARPPAPRAAKRAASADAPEIMVQVMERLLQQLAAADLGYTPQDVCFSTREPVSFEAPDPAMLSAARMAYAALAPATACRFGPALGRVVDRERGNPRILFFSRTYESATADRVFVVAGWYEHTMSARRYVFVFKRTPLGWRLEAAERFGAV